MMKRAADYIVPIAIYIAGVAWTVMDGGPMSGALVVNLVPAVLVAWLIRKLNW
jgi:hypothetical protein